MFKIDIPHHINYIFAIVAGNMSVRNGRPSESAMDFDLDELAEDVPVFGTQYQATNCEEFYAAALQLNEYGLLEDMKIVLKREPNNENDPYAIKVSGRWELDDGSKRTVHLGYVPRKAAFMIGERTEGEGKLHGELASIERHPEFVMDIRINVYVKY